MSDAGNPFDHRRDPELGEALRRLLEPENQAAFVARVVARFEPEEAGALAWNVLARWARLGIAAALLVVVLARLSAPRPTEPVASLDGALGGSGGGPAHALLTAQAPPDASVMFEVAGEP